MRLLRLIRGLVAAVALGTPSLAAQAVCGTPGKDGPGGVLGGIVNTYYPGLTASASGTGAITLGAATGAVATTITPGDLLLVIQMQDAAINGANSSAYGAGTTTGSGSTNLNNAGRYEYVTATNAVGAGGGSLTFRGTGPGNGLLNTYTDAAATGAQGQRRYQIIRVPQYSQATLGSTLTAAYWTGTTGGVLAIDVAGQLTLGGTVSVDGRGFRGGAGLGFTGGAGGANTDYLSLSSNHFHGMKGEGVAGTPRWVLDPQTGTNADLGIEGYPNGDAARGAPANAGGGGTDGHPSVNDQNSGGGGGSNGGAGGQGGFSWNTGLDVGGLGGTAFLVGAVDRIVLGGGGGAGSRNNSAAPQNAGGAGGGIVLMRAGTVTGTGTITADGVVGRSPANDGAGGGGAGGSVVVLALNGGLGGLTAQARGGNGGNAWITQAGAAAAHGPGGGGGGGTVVVSSATSVDVAGGARGSTTTGLLQYGATPGAGGRSLTAAIGTSPGTPPGASCVPVLTVTKATTTDTVTNGPGGTTATYQIVVSNAASRDTARSVTLIDSLPAGFTYASSSAPVLAGGASRPVTTDPSAAAPIPQWSTFSIPAGGSVTQTFVTTVAATVPNGTYSNPARAIYLDPARATPTGTTSAAYDTTGTGEDVTVLGADLTISKTHSGSFTAGVNGVYTIVVHNGGSVATSGVVTVTDTLPTGLAFVSAAGTNWTCGAVGPVVTCTGPNPIAAGGNAAAITLTVSVGLAAAPSVTNGAWVAGGGEPVINQANNSATDPTAVAVLPADLATTKTGPATATPGVNVVYTLSTTNAGPNAALNVVITDTLPAGATFVSASNGGAVSGNVVTWPTIASMASGAPAVVLTVTVNYAAAGSYLNLAAGSAATPDPVPANNDGSTAGARVTTVVALSADVGVTNSGAATATAGANVDYTITATNAGPDAAASVVVTDTLPAGATFVSASNGGTLSGNVVTWPVIPSLASGGATTYTLTLSYGVAGSYTNAAAVASSTADSNPANNRAPATTVVATSADVVTTKTGPATALVAQNISYTITVTNVGPNPAANVAVTDTLPAGLTFVSASGGGTLAGTVVTWPTVGSLAAGASQSFTVSLRVTAAGTFTNVAAAVSPTVDPIPGNNRATATTTAAPPPLSADVVTTKSGPASVTVGGNAVYTIQTVNAGPDAAANVLITDTLPAGLTFGSATGNPTKSGNVLTWPVIPSLANGASVTYTVTAGVTAAGTFTNIAASVSPTPDPNHGNNNGSSTASRVVTIAVESADLVTTKTGPATATVGEQITYTIVTRNDGPNAAASVVVTDSLPAGAQFISASNGGVFAAGVVTWPVVPSLANGATLTYTVTLVISTPGSAVNVARSTSPTADPVPPNNRGTTTTTVAASADVVTTKIGPPRVDAGASFAYQIKSKNLGPQAAVGVTVIDSLPAGLTFVSASNGGSLAGRVVTWPVIPSLAAGDSVLYSLVVTAPLAGQLRNVVASTAITSDPDPRNNDGTGPGGQVITDVTPIDLAVAKSHTGDFIPGTIATYAVTVSNVGTVATTGPVTMTDSLPAGLTYRSFSGAGWTCSNASRVVTCRFDTVPFAAGASTVLTLKVLVDTTAANPVMNRVVISTPGDTDESGNNVGTDSAPLQRVSPLVIEKRASRPDAEIGDVIDYTVIVSNRTVTEVPDVSVTDELPRGFTYQGSTARADRIPIADPVGAPGPRLTFALGSLGPGAFVYLTYRVRLGAGATLGDGANRARARSATGVESPVAIAVVRVTRGVFSDRGIIFGKLYLTRRDTVGADSAGVEVRDSVGIPGVRLFLENGTSVVTDLEGKYSLYGIVSGLHVVRVDPTTLPGGGRLISLDSRNARDPSSRFVDLKDGELHKADFAVRFMDSVGATTGLRRDRGEISGVIIDSLAGTGSAGQARPVIAVDAATDTAGAPAYRPLAEQSSANPIDEASRLPITRLPGTTTPATVVPNGSVELVPARRSVPADGNTAMAVRIKVLGQDRNPIAAEQPITLEASLGRWLVNDLDPVEPGVQTVLANGQGEFTLVASSEAGVGEIRVTNGLRVTTAQIAFLPATRPMLVNGLVEARIDLRSLLKNGLAQVTSADRFERELRDIRATSDDGRFSAAARGALFLRGKVKGSTLLTLAYDTENDPERRMFRDIQPDEFYPVYGDASIKEFGAQSFDRLYVRVDANRSFALYGDYVTPSAGNGALAARELGAYQRSLTGAVVHGEGRAGQVNVFASRDRLSQVVEEIPGQGISGPYQLRRSDGRINSEKVEIVTRDRNQPSRIIKSVPLARFTDYTLEPFTGRLLFFAPVPSVDADLNPVSIRVLYEVERTGQEFWVYGADGQLKIGNRAEVGAGIVRDEQPLGNRNLYSANAALRIAPGTVLVTEVARTDGDSASFRGTAARFELRHSSARLQGTIFGATSDAGFSNQSSTFRAGRSELGFRGSAVIDDRTRFIGEAIRSEDKTTGRRIDGLLASFERQFGKSLRAELGYRHGSDTYNATSETNALRTRVTYQLPKQPRASVFGEFEQDLAVGDQRRGALGGQYVLFDRLRLYGRHEFLSSFTGPFALNGSQRQATTVIGLDAGYTKDGQFFGEYRASDAFSGRQTEAAIGLRNRWNLRRGLVVNTGFERVAILKGGQGGATALTAGVEYTTSPLWRGTARFEYRFTPAGVGDDFLATLGYARKLDRDWTVLGRALYNTFGQGGKRTRNQIGFAWRETDHNRWNGLARWENRFERLAPNTSNATVLKSNILSAHLNYQPLNSVWLSGRLAGKWATDQSNGLTTSTRAVLGSVRALYDFLPSWDAGVIGSLMASNGRQYGVGVEAGRIVVTNMRVAVGYNVFGFKNQDLTSDGATTDRGLYLHFGFKFSEDLFKRTQ